MRTVAGTFALLAAFGAAILSQVYYGLNQDTSWLIEVAERVLDGAVPYRDILEPNPPASFLIEVPAVLLGRALGMSAEAATAMLVMAAAAASMALAGRILAQAGVIDRLHAPILLAFAGAVLVAMPMQSFGQREHVALLAGLPALAASCARLRGREPALIAALLAGIGAGVAVSIKPVFALGFLLPAAALATGPRRGRLLRSPELWAAGTIALAYGAAVVVMYPDYRERMLPLVTQIYLPSHISYLELLLEPMTLIWAATMVGAWCSGAWKLPPGRILMLSSLGFEAAVLVQGKGFTYHGLPAVALGELAYLSPFFTPGALSTHTLALACATVLAGFLTFSDRPTTASEAPGLSEAVSNLSRTPKLLMIGADLRYGAAFARRLGGTWVGSSPSNWVSFYALVQDPDADRDPRFAGPMAAERELYADDVVRGRPDVILVKGEGWLDWAGRSPRLAAALARYREAGRFGPVILLRADRPGLAGIPPRSGAGS